MASVAWTANNLADIFVSGYVNYVPINVHLAQTLPRTTMLDLTSRCCTSVREGFARLIIQQADNRITVEWQAARSLRAGCTLAHRRLPCGDKLLCRRIMLKLPQTKGVSHYSI
jgi:hypothetical protein